MTTQYLNAAYFGCDMKLPFEIFFFTRTGGCSEKPFDSLNMSAAGGDDTKAVSANEAAALEVMDHSRLYMPKQVHSAKTIILKKDPPLGVSREIEADAVMTDLQDVAVGIVTADCVPILIGHRDGNAVAAVHAGWRGLMDGVIGSAVQAFLDQGMEPHHLIAFIGPAIGPCCYEVSEDVIDAFQSGFIDNSSVICAHGSGRTTLDLPAASGIRLLDAGLKSEAIHMARRCTACEGRSFFSHRRDRGKTGRQLSAIAIKSDKNEKNLDSQNYAT